MSGARPKGFNLNTYKLHALGDYPQTIRERGTTDNYTSQWVRSNMEPFPNGLSLTTAIPEQVELTHRTSKGAYQFVNNHDTPGDIGRVLRRREVLGCLDRHQPLEPSPRQVICDTNSGERSVIAQGESDGIALKSFLTTPRGMAADPAKRVRILVPLPSYLPTALKGFETMLRNYILRWTSDLDPDVTSYSHFTDEDRCHVNILGNTLYCHKTLKLRYTTYDMQKGEDMMYQRLHPDIMVLSDSDEHPYLYGRVLDIFHANVGNSAKNSILTGETGTARLEMVWVRWFRVDMPSPEGPLGFHTLRYPSVSFCRAGEPDAFGLIHPDEIVRTVHLIPRFKLHRTAEYLAGPTAARPKGEEDDWRGFSVNMWVASCITIFTCSSQLAWLIETFSCASEAEALAICTCDISSHG